VVRYLDWLLDLGFASGIILSVKVKVLGGGFDLWLGDNIGILSMVKRAHLLFLTHIEDFYRDSKIKRARFSLPRPKLVPYLREIMRSSWDLSYVLGL
jgi:hypothetical protein